MVAPGGAGLGDEFTAIFQPEAHNSDTSRTVQNCNDIVCRAVENALADVNAFDADKDEPLEVGVLRSGRRVKKQTLHSDFRAGDLKPGRPQRSAMIVLKDNTHIMLADGTAVVAHRYVSPCRICHTTCH